MAHVVTRGLYNLISNGAQKNIVPKQDQVIGYQSSAGLSTAEGAF
jgi:hypothetical protein